MKGKIILNLAISLDGFIARADGSFDWISGDGNKSLDTENKFDFSKFLKDIDAIVMGRKSFEHTPKEGMEMFKSTKIYVGTSKNLKSDYVNVEFVKEDILEKVIGLKEEGKIIWLYGGAEILDSFVKADVIDEYIIGLIPIILGNGRRLFLKDNPEIKLRLEEISSREGIVIARYSRRR